MEEIIAALKNEEEAVEWAKETLDTLSNMCPTSMKISLQLYHIGAQLSFIDCMRMEYQVAGKCVVSSTFSIKKRERDKHTHSNSICSLVGFLKKPSRLILRYIQI